MTLESLIYGLITGVVILLIAWRMGARPRAWREAIATTILYVALWLALKGAGFGGTETVTVAFIAAVLLVWVWKRLVRRTGAPTEP